MEESVCFEGCIHTEGVSMCLPSRLRDEAMSMDMLGISNGTTGLHLELTNAPLLLKPDA